MFDSIEYIGSGSPKRASFLISLVAHAGVVTLAIITPLFFFRAAAPLAPGLPTPVMLLPDLPVPIPSSGDSRSTTSRNPEVVRLPPNIVPPSIPKGIPESVPEEIPDIRQLAINQNPGGQYSGGSPGSGVGFGPVGDALVPARVAPPPLRKEPESSPVSRRAPVRVSEGVIASKLVRRVDPVYPPIAIRARIQGVVVLQVLVNEEGAVEEVSVISGHQLLAPAAIEAVKQWRYSPTLLNGQHVPVKATVTVNFILR
jgi:protein TonB